MVFRRIQTNAVVFMLATALPITPRLVLLPDCVIYYTPFFYAAEALLILESLDQVTLKEYKSFFFFLSLLPVPTCPGKLLCQLRIRRGVLTFISLSYTLRSPRLFSLWHLQFGQRDREH